MLVSTSYRELKVVDIARGAGTSPATFYQYFPDVESAILVLAEEMADDGLALGQIVRDGSWKGKQAYVTSAELVDAFMDFWEEHRSLLRVVDLASIEGDLRFREVRTRFLRELTSALNDTIEKVQGVSGPGDDVDPLATGAVLTSMLAQVAAHRHGFEFWGIRVDNSRRSMARIVAMTVTGQKPPAGV
jgi:AcrR family transcriptional regulator